MPAAAAAATFEDLRSCLSARQPVSVGRFLFLPFFFFFLRQAQIPLPLLSFNSSSSPFFFFFFCVFLSSCPQRAPHQETHKQSRRKIPIEERATEGERLQGGGGTKQKQITGCMKRREVHVSLPSRSRTLEGGAMRGVLEINPRRRNSEPRVCKTKWSDATETRGDRNYSVNNQRKSATFFFCTRQATHAILTFFFLYSFVDNEGGGCRFVRLHRVPLQTAKYI